MEKNDCIPNSADLNLIYFNVCSGPMMEKCHKLQLTRLKPKPKTTDESTVDLQTIWEEHIKAVA